MVSCIAGWLMSNRMEASYRKAQARLEKAEARQTEAASGTSKVGIELDEWLKEAPIYLARAKVNEIRIGLRGDCENNKLDRIRRDDYQVGIFDGKVVDIDIPKLGAYDVWNNKYSIKIPEGMWIDLRAALGWRADVEPMVYEDLKDRKP